VALFSIEQRIALAERCVAELSNVEITGYEGLTTDFAIECGANVMLRGLRTSGDLEYEFQLDWMNHRLSDQLETIFLAPSDKVSGISSTLVKEVAKYGGDYEQFVPLAIAQALEDVYS
jgi:pantetheine-phosphate adenylyltransferase